MNRICVRIDKLVLNGLCPLEGKAFTSALQAQFQQVLANSATRREWARSQRTPVMKLGPMPMEPGVGGAVDLGGQVAKAVARRL